MKIRSVHNKIRTEKMKKVALSAHDDKRYLVLGETDTLPHGHFSIIDDKMMHAVMEVEVKEARENLNGERRDICEKRKIQWRGLCNIKKCTRDRRSVYI